MDWVACEKALHDVVASSTGMAGANVAWAYQNAPREATPLPFVRLHRENVHSYGLLDDDAGIALNPTPSPGAEILLLTNVQGRFELRVDVFSNEVVGNTSAYAIAEKIRAKFSQTSGLDALDSAGLAMLDRGTVQGVPDLVDQRYESRAMLTCRIGYSDQLSEGNTYISEVDMTGTVVTPSGVSESVQFVAVAVVETGVLTTSGGFWFIDTGAGAVPGGYATGTGPGPFFADDAVGSGLTVEMLGSSGPQLEAP